MRWRTTLLLLFFLLNLRPVSLSYEKWVNLTDFIPCIANITSYYTGKTDFLFLSEELNYVEPNDEIIRHIRHSVIIQRVEQFAGRFGFFVIFPTRGKMYESLFKVIQPSVYNK